MLRNAIVKHVKEIPYEGTEVDIDGIETLIENILKGFVTHCHKFNKTNNGYILDKTYYTREDIVRMYINSLKL